MKKIIVILLALGWTAAADARYLVRHSQDSSRVPSCPAGYDTLWNGFSYVGSALSNWHSFHQDLASPGSCLEQLIPLNILQCRFEDCAYRSGADSTNWLVSARYEDEAAFALNSNNTANTALTERVSRCVVCEGDAPIIVRHSQAATPPSCPTGYSSMWTGVSVMNIAQGSNVTSPQALGDTGSCLEQFVPHPAITCRADNYCDYYYDNPWTNYLLNSAKVTELGVRYNNTADNRALNKARISQCRVCSKD